MIRRFARPYARVILELSKSPEAAQKIHGDLVRFDESRRLSKELVDLLDNPSFAYEAKAEIVRTLGDRLAVSEMSRRVLNVLVQNHRINDTGAIADALRAMINEAMNVAVAQVRTAHALDKEETRRLQAALEKKLGQTVELEVTMDPSILGGFVAHVGSEIYDASVLGRIERLREAVA
ncbi:MAG TPA: ATP synthase F1 subunit delta [Thermoanaerobaculia bacterium]